MSRPRPPDRYALRDWLRANWRELALVSGTVAAAFILRWAFIIQHPYPWSGDEASIGMEARRILDDRDGKLLKLRRLHHRQRLQLLRV